MTIGDYLRAKDLYTYNLIVKKYGFNPDKPKKKEQSKNKSDIKLGDSIENLMKANSYKRIGRRIKQTRWE